MSGKTPKAKVVAKAKEVSNLPVKVAPKLSVSGAQLDELGVPSYIKEYPAENQTKTRTTSNTQKEP